MIIAVASGKGGTGKTTVSTSLLEIWDTPVAAVDLDVEEPNLHLFLGPEHMAEEKVFLEVPVLDMSRCTLCGACTDLCQFKAVSIIGKSLMVFPEMCHGCGGCIAVCPEQALHPGARELGAVVSGTARDKYFLMGRLRIGEAMSPPLMRAVKRHLDSALQEAPTDVIIDAPPGVSCPAVNAVIDASVIVLVTEPTPFGLHDLALAVDAFATLGKPMGVVINRAGLGDDSVDAYCKEKKLPVLARIPFDRSIAEAYSNGQCIATINAEMHSVFINLRDAVRGLAATGGAHA